LSSRAATSGVAVNVRLRPKADVATKMRFSWEVEVNRPVDGDHNIGCKIAGIGAMMLKSEFVKKA